MNPVSGGPCEGVRNLIPELKHHGILADVVCLDHPDEVFIKNDSFTVYALGKSFTPWKYHPQLLSWLIENLTAYDIVLVRGLWLYHSYAVHKAVQILKRKKVNSIPKVYIIPHGMLDPWFQQAGSRRLKAVRNVLYWHLKEKRVVASSDGVLFTCSCELELARKTFAGYYPKKEINIGYGINQPPAYNDGMLTEFQNKSTYEINQPFLLFLGRIHEKKGIHLLLAAYQKLLHALPNLPALVIAGPGIETEYGKKMIRLAQESTTLNKKIFFSGMLSGAAKWGAFYSCDAFILPSHQENFGIAVVEALACGKAVLISNRINIFQDIEEAGAGLINSDSEVGVISLIQSWVEMTTDKKNEMSRSAKQLFETRFNIRTVAGQMIEKLEL